MYTYNITQWIIFFFIYCFLGWIIESTIVSYSQKRFVNRGFLKGTILPIYGFGALIILLVTLPVKKNIFLIYLFGMISATILEYIASLLMDSLLTMKYWDYSNEKFNLKGRICLKSSLFWGVLSIFLTLVVHNPIEKLVLNIPYINILALVLIIYLIIDFSFSLYNAINLNKILSILETIKNEIELTYEEIKEKSKLSSYDTDSLKKQLDKLKDNYSTATSKLNFFHIHIIRSYPKANSKKFNSSLKDIKNKVFDKISIYTKDDR